MVGKEGQGTGEGRAARAYYNRSPKSAVSIAHHEMRFLCMGINPLGTGLCPNVHGPAFRL